MSKSFDAVGWMRKRREEIDREDEGLSWEERSKKTASILRNNPVWRRLENRKIGAKSRTSVGLPEE